FLLEAAHGVSFRRGLIEESYHVTSVDANSAVRVCPGVREVRARVARVARHRGVDVPAHVRGHELPIAPTARDVHGQARLLERGEWQWHGWFPSVMADRRIVSVLARKGKRRHSTKAPDTSD